MFFGGFLPLPIKLRLEKKEQLSGHRLELISDNRLNQITTGKKGTVVWPLGAMSDCFGGFVAMFFGGFLNQITNYDQKKKIQLSGHWLECLLCTFDLLHPRVDRPSAMTLWGINLR